MFAGLDVGFKRTSVCIVDETGKIVWRGVVDTHPEMITAALHRWRGRLANYLISDSCLCAVRSNRDAKMSQQLRELV